MQPRSIRTLTAITLLVALPPMAGMADVRPHVLFSDHMVLQCDRSVPVWGTADPQERVTVRILDHEVSTTADGEGNWQLRLGAMPAGGPVEMTISGSGDSVTIRDVLVGEVWIASGQSNMEWSLERTDNGGAVAAKSANPGIRLFKVPHAKADEPRSTVDSEWVHCGPETTPGFSAVAYYFGRDLEEALGKPVGLIQTTWGGSPAEAWMSREALSASSEGAAIDRLYERSWARFGHALQTYVNHSADGRRPRAPWRPTELYNGMVAPLIPYAFRGAIWYQGESNASRAYQYRTLFSDMIRNWRHDWRQGDFPFLLVQLAPFRKIKTEPTESDWAELREAQWLSTKVLPRTGMAVITDVGEEDDIHPRKKEPVGARLALAARALAYDQDIVYSGPLYESALIAGDRIILRFDHVGGGLVARGGKLTGFTIAGVDRRFVNAHATIKNDTVVVHSPAVANPAAVRYGWADYPTGNLWNVDGLPATPFRTDDFPLTTMPKDE